MSTDEPVSTPQTHSDGDSEQNFQKKISENVKLHPPTPQVTSKHPLTVDSGLRKHIRGNREVTAEKQSKYIGVYWELDREMWHARFVVNGRSVSIGRYILEEEAARNYDRAVRKLVKRLARYNFSDGVSEVAAVAEQDSALAEAKKSDESLPVEDECFQPSTVLDKAAVRERMLAEEEAGSEE